MSIGSNSIRQQNIQCDAVQVYVRYNNTRTMSHTGEYCPCRSIRERNSRRRREPKASPFESELSIFSLRKGALRKWYNSLYQSKTSWYDILPNLSRRPKITLTPTKQKCSRSYATLLFKLQGNRKASVEKSGLFKGGIPPPPPSYTYRKGDR